jgi:acid phosphatase type 7
MDPSGAVAFLETELKKPEATAARWRFVQSHYAVYSGGTTHGASGIAAIEKLCDTYHVAVYWSGHDHIYERSHQVSGGRVIDTGDALSAGNGTVYIVSGGGGAPLYGVAKIATTHVQASTNNYVDVVADDATLSVKAFKLDGSPIDSFAISQ